MINKQISIPYNDKKLNGSMIMINNSNNENINLPYILFIPENINEESELIVSCSTPATSKTGYDETISSIESNMYIDNNVKEMINELNYPVLFPIIPRFPGFYSTFLSSKVKNNDTSELEQWIDAGYSKLEKENIGKIKNIDKQVCEMIEESKKVLEHYTDINEKVIMSGYSAGAHFANGFTALHPDIVDMEICGGQAGLQIQPFSELKDEKLNYPLGFNDIGSDKLEQYKQVSHFFYMGDQDINNPAEIEKNKEEKKAHFSACYTDDEVKQIDNIYNGSEQQNRFEVNKMIYDSLGIDAKFKKYDGNHQSVQINDEVSKDVVNWVKTKTKKQELTQEKPKVKTLIQSPNGFTDALVLTLITGFVGGIITTIMINIII